MTRAEREALHLEVLKVERMVRLQGRYDREVFARQRRRKLEAADQRYARHLPPWPQREVVR